MCPSCCHLWLTSTVTAAVVSAAAAAAVVLAVVVSAAVSVVSGRLSLFAFARPAVSLTGQILTFDCPISSVLCPVLAFAALLLWAGAPQALDSTALAVAFVQAVACYPRIPV